MSSEQSVRCAVAVPLAPDRAFALFTDGLGTWWPSEYTWSGDVLDTIGIEAGEGGMCFELGPHGFRCDWGRVLAWEPAERLVITWQISPRREPVPDPAKASEIEVRFAAGDGGGTRVELEHRAFERHGEETAGYRDALASPQGWPYILDRYARAAG